MRYYLDSIHYILVEVSRLYSSITIGMCALARPVNYASKRLLAEPSIYLRHHSTERIYERVVKKINEVRVDARVQDTEDS